MQEPSLVLYYGSDAAAVEQRWADQERPFDIIGQTDAEAVPNVLLEEDVDCFVCSGGSDRLSLVDRVRESFEQLPVVAFGTGELDAGMALERGVTHYVDLGETDPVDALETLEPVVDRYRRERRERTMLDSLLENIPLSVYFKDRQSRHVRVSDEMAGMIGDPFIESPDEVRYHTAEAIVGNTDFDLYPLELAENATSDDRKVIETEEPVQNRIEHAYGSAFDGAYVTTSKAPWYDERGNVVGVVGVTRDISERKQYEHQLERQNERLERFAGVLSHDLRNPLEVARGRLNLAREDGDEEHFDAIERALGRMDELIDDVLTLARHGEAVSDPVAVSVATVAADAWNVVESGDATLEVETSATVLADSGRLGQLFENLFRNAVEHGSMSPQSQAPEDAVGASSDEPSVASAPEDAVEHGSTGPGSQGRQDAVEHGSDSTESLTITVGDLQEWGGFFVADDGVGIPAEDRESVFDAGFSTANDGTGLGLNIVRTIADAHGWHVSVTDSAESGARFEFDNVRQSND